MRMCLECYATYFALLSTFLTGALTFNLSDASIDWVANKAINISFLMFGPVLFTICVAGFYNIKGLSLVCEFHGIEQGQFNFINIFILVLFLLISLGISYWGLMEKTFYIAETHGNENTIVFRMS